MPLEPSNNGVYKKKKTTTIFKASYVLCGWNTINSFPDTKSWLSLSKGTSCSFIMDILSIKPKVSSLSSVKIFDNP